MIDLAFEDSRHLQAAEGWLGLGNHLEAKEELDQISPAFRAYPAVLAVRYAVYASEKNWEMAAQIARAISEREPESPIGPVKLAHALHEMKRTQEAWNVLLPVAQAFPGESIINYNLACYACQLGNLKEAMEWLEKAIDLAGTNEVKQMALDDPDLEPLWSAIGETASGFAKKSSACAVSPWS
jgi:predicted Zn-dependent protease